MRRLIVIAGPCAGIYPLDGPTIGLGRSSGNAIKLPVEEISRHHAELIFDGTALKVRDLNSRNGTFVNNRRVTESQLNPGDHLEIGGVDMVYDISETAPVVAPAASPSTAQQQIGELSQKLTSLRAEFADANVKAAAFTAELARQNKDLCTQVAVLGQQKLDLTSQLLVSQEQLTALREQTAALTAKLQGAEQRVGESQQQGQAELGRVNAELAQLKQQFALAVKASEEHAALRQQHAELANRFHSVEQRFIESEIRSRADLAAARSELESTKQAAACVEILTAERTSQAEQLAVTQQQVEAAAASTAQMKAEWTRQTGQLQSALTHAQDTITGLRSELEQVRTVATHRDELARANQQLSEQLAARDAELERNREVASQVAALGQQKQDLTAQLLAAQEQLAALREQTADLTVKLRGTELRGQAELDRVNVALAQANQQIAAAVKTSEDHAVLRQQHVEQRLKAESALQARQFDAALAQAQDTISGLRVELEKARTDVARRDELSEQLVIAQQHQQDQLLKQLATRDAVLERVCTTGTALRTDLEHSRKVAAQVAVLSQQKEELATQLLASQAQLAGMREQTANLTAKLQGAEQRIGETRQRGQTELNGVKTELVQIKQQLAAAVKASDEHTGQLQAALTHAEETVTGLRGELEQARTVAAQCDELTVQLAAARQQQNEWQKQLAARDSELESAGAELESAQQAAARVTVLTAQSETQSHQLALAQQQAAAAAAGVTRMKTEWAQQTEQFQVALAQAQGTITDLRNELAQARTVSVQRDEFARSNHQLGEQLAVTQQQQQQWQKRLAERDAELERVCATATALRVDLEQSRQVAAQVATLGQQKEELTAQLLASQNQLAALHEETADLTAKLQSAEQRVDETQQQSHAELRLLNADLARTKQQVVDTTDTITGLRSELEQARTAAAQRDEISEQLVTAQQHQYDQWQKQLAARDAELERSREVAAKVAAQMVGLGQQKEDLATQLLASQEQLAAFRQHHAALTVRFHSAEQKWKAEATQQVEQFQVTLVHAQDTVNGLRAELEQSRIAAVQRDELTRANHELRKQIAQWQERLAERDAELERVCASGATLRADLVRSREVAAQMVGLGQQKEDLAIQLRASQNQAAASREQTAALTAKLQGAEKHAGESQQRGQAELDRVNAALAQTKQQFAAAVKAAEEQAANQQRIEAAAATARQESAQLAKRISELTQQSERVCADLDQTRTALRETQDGLKQSRQLAAAQDKEFSRQNRELAARLATEQQRLEHEAADRHRLLAELTGTRDQTVHLRAEIAEASAKLEIAAAANLRVAELTEQNRQLETKLVVEAQRAQGELARIRAQLDLLAQRAAQADALAASNERLTAQLHEAQTTAADATASHHSESQPASAHAELDGVDNNLAVSLVAAVTVPAASRVSTGKLPATGIRPTERRRRCLC